MAPIVPPIKCQGIKTKIVPAIRSLKAKDVAGRWIEPFCGSCVVPFNLRPERALLCDSNEHIIRFYTDLRSGSITSGLVREYLSEQGARLKRQGEGVYYEIRDEFNRGSTSLAFIFLNRACFNGVMRFNRKGQFNVPFCRKPERFARAYITKITNQVKACASILRSVQWVFQIADFRATLACTAESDFVYADPPYAGRHVDYYNSWSENDELDLAAELKKLPCRFLLSTWYQNKYRTNPNVLKEWSASGFTINTFEHFYHVGPTESLRNSMTEALISNFAGVVEAKKKKAAQPSLFDFPENGMEDAGEIANPTSRS
ncbi:MAG TPA: Dam family site-specific DNA-(adenine-N6)-methyltransferase [Pirellulales bacterium]|nr:Dam family site-specific DNA-(adenine-N6)-methyltransferase [Pirellulales bacterium]